VPLHQLVHPQPHLSNLLLPVFVVNHQQIAVREPLLLLEQAVLGSRRFPSRLQLRRLVPSKVELLVQIGKVHANDVVVLGNGLELLLDVRQDLNSGGIFLPQLVKFLVPLLYFLVQCLVLNF